MKRILYLLFAAVALLSSCSQTDIDTTNSQIATEEGKVTMVLNLKIQGASLQTVEARAGETYAGKEKENVTDISGYAFVFAADPNAENGYSDSSELLQKVALSTIVSGDDKRVYITLDEYPESCFIRLMTCMTDAVSQKMDAFVSQKMVADGATESVTTFAEYKHISVGLDGYYVNAENPDPTALTNNPAFPLASPSISMPNGITQEEIDQVDKVIYMESVASKLDVTSSDESKFTLQEVTLLNGAKCARMRSTVLKNDGVTPINKLPLPINLGGTVQYKALAVTDNTTAATPIYFFPNEGDGPFDAPLSSDEEADKLSDATNTKNPTYLILKGVADGYDVEGYYKIAIQYVTEQGDTTYSINRNTHYKVNLNKVDNPGYATIEEAIAGVASNISFDITINTNDDSRNETIVSESGLYSMELNTSSIYIRSYIYEGETLDLDMSFWLGRNDDADDSYYTGQKAYITSTEGVTINSLKIGDTETAVDSEGSFAIDWESGYAVNFSISPETSAKETITIRYGNIIKKIPLYFENSRISMFCNSPITVNGDAVFTDGANEVVGSMYTYETASTETSNFDAFIKGANNGNIEKYPDIDNTLVNMDNFDGRTFDGYIYSTENAGGAIRLYCHQGSLPFHLAYELNSTPNTEVDPYYVLDYVDFKHLSTSVNSSSYKENFDDCNFRMLQDVDLQEGDSSRKHNVIGVYNYSFSGNFDGDNHMVLNLKVDNTSYYQGLFGYIENGEVKNITVYGRVKGRSYVGGVVGYMNNNSTISNCKNYASVEGDSDIGGVVGYANADSIDSKNEISNCTNLGTVTCTGDEDNYVIATGGVIGTARYTTVRNCRNEKDADVTNSEQLGVGGVVGYMYSSTLSGCYNLAIVKGYKYIGGIVGSTSNASDGIQCEISNCTNSGQVTCTNPYSTQEFYTGGIVGSAYNANISNCENSKDATVTVVGKKVGGVVGYMGANSILSNCYNFTTVKGGGDVGGVVGYTMGSSDNGRIEISNCINSGKVESTLAGYSSAGGLIGYASYYTTIHDCKNENSGNVIAKNEKVGGVVGYMSNSCLIDGCSNFASVDGDNNIGGVVGYSYRSEVSRCINSGSVTSPIVYSYKNTCSYLGGVAGYIEYTTISDCRNEKEGVVTASAKDVGGVVGFMGSSSTLRDCHNFTAVTGYAAVGGIVGFTRGYYGQEVEISNCTNSGKVQTSATSESNAGGVVGHAYYTTLNYCRNFADISGDHCIGGVVGYSSSKITISNCSNSAYINGSKEYAAGIVAKAYDCLTISDCKNTGAIKANAYVAGVVALTSKDVSYSNVYITNCVNTGSIESTKTTYASYTGGLIANNRKGTLVNSYNTGIVKGAGGYYTGGVVAFNDNDSRMYNCYNIAQIVSTGSSSGLILGRNDGILSNCYYLDTLIPGNKTVGTSKTEAYMKGDDFLDELNSYVDTHTNTTHPLCHWVKDVNGINDGYPILEWEASMTD